jgi:uroporphyrinogen decarboxylase
MNKKDRVMTTLDHTEPDVVPITEMAIEPVHLERITQTRLLGEGSLQTQVSADRRTETNAIAATVLAYQKLGLELIPCELSAPDGWKPRKNPDGTMIDEWGRVLSRDTRCRTWIPTGSIFTSTEDFERFPLADPDASGRMFAIEEMRRRIGDDMALGGFIRDPFACAWEMFKIDDFVTWLYEKPSFLQRVIENVTDFNVEIIKQIADAKADFIFSGGDYAERKGPLVPPKFFKDVVFPNLRRQVGVAHRAGLKFIKHSDGNLNSILDELAEIVDGLHSLDPSAGMDIGDVKRRYGDKLVLIGNVSVDNLCRKTKQEIVEETKECLRKAAPGGGYILSSSNSWYTDAKFENCLAMVDAGRKYGRYPMGTRD